MARVSMMDDTPDVDAELAKLALDDDGGNKPTTPKNYPPRPQNPTPGRYLRRAACYRAIARRFSRNPTKFSNLLQSRLAIV